MNIDDFTNQKWDLIVAGGGLTGMAAAVSARRNGLKKVLVIEKAGYLGGAAVTSLINPFMPYWTEKDGKQILLSQGLFTEFRHKFEELRTKGKPGYTEGHEVNELHEEYVKLTFDKIAQEEHIQPLFHSVLCEVTRTNGKIQSVTAATKAGKLTFKADYFIDCTGDAQLAFLAGCPFILGRKDGLCQPMTLCFRIANVDKKKFRESRAIMQRRYAELKEEGKIKNPREDVLVFDTLVDGVIHLNSTRVIKHDPTNPFDVTEAEMIAREQMLELYNFLHDNVPGCENSELLYSASEIGVRESRMIVGKYVLTEEDLKNCTVFPDSIAAGNYDIDIHNPEGSGTSHYYFKPGTWYTIPYRSLQPVDTDNLLVAGRCISSTHEAQASYRIMPIVTTLGEAAGTAAAVASKSNTSFGGVDIQKLQTVLKQNGAFLG